MQMQKQLEYNLEAKRRHDSLKKYVSDWCSNNQWQIGVVEVAVGVSVLHYAITSGQLKLDSEFQAVQAHAYTEGLSAGCLSGLGVGGIAGMILGGIGTVALAGTGAIGIPIGLVAEGSRAILKAAGYNVTDIVEKFISPEAIASFSSSSISPAHFDGSKLLIDGAFATAAIWLMFDGAKRILKDGKLKIVVEKIKDRSVKIKIGADKVVIEVSEKVCAKLKQTSNWIFRIISKLGFNNFFARLKFLSAANSLFSKMYPS